MKKNQKISVTGKLVLHVWEKAADGSRFLAQTIEDKNLVVNAGLNKIKTFLSGSGASTYLTKFKVGTGTTAAAGADTNLETPVDITTGVQIKSFTSTDETAVGVIVYGIDLTDVEAVGNTLTEAGLFFSDGVMFARRILSSPIVKTSSNTVTGTWTITIEAV